MKPPKGGRGSSKIREQAARFGEGTFRQQQSVAKAFARHVKSIETGKHRDRFEVCTVAAGAKRVERRGHSSLHNAAMRAVRTKGREGLRHTDRKAAWTQRRNR